MKKQTYFPKVISVKIAMKIFLALLLVGGVVSQFVVATKTAQPQQISLPRITHFEWGTIKVDTQKYEDCRIWLNHHEKWDWNKSGTHHVPGIQIADLSDFIDNVDIIILSEGVNGVLQIKPETLAYLQQKNKEVHCLRTPKAVELYNKLAMEHKRVGALLHSTC